VKKFLSYKEVETKADELIFSVVTKPAKSFFKDEDKEAHKECIELLEENKINVFEKERLHFKAVIIDDEILYVGSINSLSIVLEEYLPEDYMLRFSSEALVDEIIENAVGREDFENYILKE